MKLKKPFVAQRAKEIAFRIIDSALSTVSLLLALRVLVATEIESLPPVFLTIYLLLAFSKVISGVPVFKKDKLKSIVNIVSAAVLIAAGILIMALGMTYAGAAILFISYFLSVLAGRVVAIIRNHSLRSVILNVLIGLFFLLLIVSSIMPNEETFVGLFFLHAFFLVGSALGHIISISFSQMRFSVMQKIIRKTFAVEILFGLLLLIVSFSFVFMTIEPAMNNNYANSLWYCFAIVTTIGFGDFTAATLVGRLLSVILGIYGIVVVALITSVIVNFYNEVKDEKEEKEEKEVVKEVEKEIEEKNGEE